MKKRLLSITLALVLCLGQTLPVSATREAQLKAEKAQTSSQLSAANARISSLESQTAALRSQISDANADLVEIITQVNILKDEIALKEVQIEETKEDLAIAEADRDDQYADMKLRIQYLYENGGDTAWAQMLLSASIVSDQFYFNDYGIYNDRF